AARKLARETPGQTLDATGLVHEAYLRLVGNDAGQDWANRAHFFAAAAEAMRRILLEQAPRKGSRQRRGRLKRRGPHRPAGGAPEADDDLLALDEALTRLAAADPQAAELVKLRYFGGLTIKQAAEALGVSPRTADAWWAYARAWLLAELQGPPG